MIDKNTVLQSNIELHTQLADTYRETEPHYRPENVERVRGIIAKIAGSGNSKNLLDVGCGQGFIIDIAHEYFEKIVGIDITPGMIDRIDIKKYKCKIDLQIAEVEKMPFDDNIFNACTAYAVIHHLHDLKPAFKEIYRVLKKDGFFYTDTDPNYYFWESMKGLSDENDYGQIINKEISAIKYKDKEIEKEYNIDASVMRNAEILKHEQGGFKEEELTNLLREVGFKSVIIDYEWFLGEAKIIHGGFSNETHVAIQEHLKSLLPLTRNIFKYISIKAIK